MTAEFIDGEVNFTGGVGRVYQYRWYLVPVEGRMALCGSGYLRDSRLRGTINDMLRDTVLVMSNQRVEVDARFFTRVRSARRLSQDNATCRPTNLPLLTGGGGTVYLEFGDAVWRN
ncbi:hypothetical protein E2K80_09110 [Rhodophyticola sp. CCM32]|uniref:hypothetical protein n=1 Tax=Rhodophyticola sp. CCM32 TaxID=2916397 RepID=UPI00107F1CA9|nr:hypothetical protein [Rhodophyticola sp. CCM32]QBY00865.1 hypothetical protein E2K80_09110 [Rhodophyticola sp. CCM32]